MKRWKTALLIAACWALALWASPGWLAGWLVAIGLPVIIVAAASRFIPDHGPKALAGWVFLFLIAMPLAAAFIFQDVPGAFDWYRENVMPAYEAIKRLLSGPMIGAAVFWVFTVFLYPAIWLLVKASQLVGYAGNPLSPPLGYVLFLPTLVFSWMFWSVAISRSLYLVGLWDPFWRAGFARPWIKQAWVRLGAWWAERRFGQGPSSAWASLFEVFSLRYASGDVFLGRPKLRIGGLFRPIGIATEKHMVTFGATGAGKSSAALVPNLCLHEGPLLCVDPKGELARITARRRGHGGEGVSGMGQKVCVVDPFGTSGWQSAAYNVFDEMARVASYDADRPVSYAGKIAEALVKPMSEKEGYWDSAAQTFLRGLVLFIFVHEPPERRTLVRLRQLLMEGDVDRYKELVESGRIERGESDPFDVLLDAMRQARTGTYGEVIAAPAASMLMMGDNQRGGVITTAQEHTVFLDAPEVQRVVGHSDFLLEDLKTQPLSVYLCLPLQMISGKEGRWLRMLVLLLIDMMMRVQKAPRPPILLAIDEFPSLGKLDGIEVVAPVLRSYGVRFWVVGQDVAQFADVYKGTWTTLIGNAAAIQFIGVTHAETVKFLVERLGKHVVTELVNEGGMMRQVPHEHPLLDEDQAARLLDPEKGNQIIWRGSRRPLLLKRARYFEYMPGWYYEAQRDHPEKLRRRMWRWLFAGREETATLAAPGAPFVAADGSAVGDGAPATARTVEERTSSWADVVAENEAGSSTTKKPRPPAQ